MASTGKSMPVKISELMGKPKSAQKAPTSERKKVEPIRIKQLMESCSKSAPRASDRSSRPTFVIPARGVRRKLYEASQSPCTSRPSLCPGKATGAGRPSVLAQRQPNRQTNRFSTFPAPSPARQMTAKPRASIFPTRTQNRPPLAKSTTKSANRSSFLLPPNSIVKHVIEQTKLDPSIQEEAPALAELVATRPTVIMTAESTKKLPRKSLKISNNNDNSRQVNGELNNTFAQPLDTSQEEKEVEKSLENKENIPPPRRCSRCLNLEPLKESNIEPVEPVSSEFTQETLKRLEKLEDMTTKMFEMLKELVGKKGEVEIDNTVSNAKNGLLEKFEEVADKENVNSDGKRRRRSTSVPTERRRSARLAMKQQPLCEDSFLTLESELMNEKSPAKPTIKVTTPAKTPVHDQFMRRRSKSERVLREYLAMKATMNYLETPDAGRIKPENTASGKKSLRRSLSRKVFDELQDLYSDE